MGTFKFESWIRCLRPPRSATDRGTESQRKVAGFVEGSGRETFLDHFRAAVVVATKTRIYWDQVSGHAAPLAETTREYRWCMVWWLDFDLDIIIYHTPTWIPCSRDSFCGPRWYLMRLEASSEQICLTTFVTLPMCGDSVYTWFQVLAFEKMGSSWLRGLEEALERLRAAQAKHDEEGTAFTRLIVSFFVYVGHAEVSNHSKPQKSTLCKVLGFWRILSIFGIRSADGRHLSRQVDPKTYCKHCKIIRRH